MEQQPGVKPEEQPQEQTQVCCCPVCGGMHHMPWGPMGMKHMMRAGMGPWGAGMGPWGAGMMPGWGMRMRPMGLGLVCILPLALGVMVGMAMANKRGFWQGRCK